MKLAFTSLISTLVLLAGCAGSVSVEKKLSSFDKTSMLLSSITSTKNPDIAKLSLFMAKMPKGGDLHHHYSGSIYVETFLEWIERKNWRIDTETLKVVQDSSISRSKGSRKLVTVPQLRGDRKLYRRLLSRWSTKDFYNHVEDQVPPDTHFFNTFSYFGGSPEGFTSEGLKRIKERAVKENVLYIESMLGRVRVKSDDYYKTAETAALNREMRNTDSRKSLDTILEKITENYLKSDRFRESIDNYIAWINSVHKGIDDESFTMRYQTYCLRILNNPLQVYTTLLAGYVAADKSPLIVGVNILGPEHYRTSLKDYTLHMKMFGYLKRKYPNIKRSLHAGELATGMVRPENLNFHIREAVEIAGAHRIGHGIDVPYEKGSLELLKKMKKSCAVEINLTSNEFILGIKGKAHPYLIYEAYGVPMVISTDDAGVSRNTLTGEYIKLASRYTPSYKKVKEYVYNSIDYSFLKDKIKKRLRKSLDKKFIDFEDKMSRLYDVFKRRK